MIRLIAVLSIGVSIVAAQHVPIVRPGPAMQAPVGSYRFGNILFPGGAPPHTQTHAHRLGGTIAGNPAAIVGAPSRGHGRGFPQRNRTIVVPYAVPVYYGDPYAYAEPQPSPNVTVVIPQQPTPSVVINHNYTPETAKPVLREYSSETTESGGLRIYEGSGKKPEENKAQAAPAVKQQAQGSDKPTIYLIALKDSTVRQAIGYWVEGDSLRYVSPQSTIQQVPLEQVDKEISQQLNAERNLEFDLNAARR
jgi:hypothetical protein